MNRTIAAGALMALAFCGAAYAQSGPPGGKVTLAQMQQRRVERLMQADANGDGKVSKEEFAAAMQQRMARFGGGAGGAGPNVDAMFARQDLNGDGFITKEEIETSTAQMFARMDPNHTGYVDMGQFRGGGMGGGMGRGGPR